MSQKDVIKLAVAVVVLLVGGGLIVTQWGGPNRTRGAEAPTRNYFYDIQSGELFAEAVSQLPPIAAPSGGEGVRAFVYTCDSCTEDELIIGYLQKLNERAIEASRKLATVDALQRQAIYSEVQSGTFVAAVPEVGQEPQWMSAMAMESKTLMQSYLTMCPGRKYALHCTPDATE